MTINMGWIFEVVHIAISHTINNIIREMVKWANIGILGVQFIGSIISKKYGMAN